MKERITELLAALITALVIAAAWLLPLRIEARGRAAREAEVDRVVTLTAVKDLGIWTEDEVSALNYWRSDLQPAAPLLEVGQPTLIRLRSADVIHTFYAPELGIGPLQVYPGKITEVRVTPTTEGRFDFFCTTVCGESHFAMKGKILVRGSTPGAPPESTSVEPAYWALDPPGPLASRVDWGRWHFEQKGCASCHGSAGRAGIENHNAMNPSVLPLSPLASNLFLFSREDVDAIVGVLEDGQDLEDLADRPPVPLFPSVLTQYRRVREVIREGRTTVPMDPEGPVPPLDMPAWRHRLRDSDIDAILAYLLSTHSPIEPQGSPISRDTIPVLDQQKKGRSS